MMTIHILGRSSWLASLGVGRTSKAFSSGITTNKKIWIVNFETHWARHRMEKLKNFHLIRRRQYLLWTTCQCMCALIAPSFLLTWITDQNSYVTTSTAVQTWLFRRQKPVSSSPFFPVIIGKQPHQHTRKQCVLRRVFCLDHVFETEVEMTSFEMPGQMVHEDMTLVEVFPLDTVRKVQQMELESTDVVVASYPKTGQ